MKAKKVVKWPKWPKQPANMDKIGNIELKPIAIIPTVLSETNGQSVLLEMLDDTIFDYRNEGEFELMDVYKNAKQHLLDAWWDDENTLHTYYDYSKKLTILLKKHIPNLKSVWLGNL